MCKFNLIKKNLFLLFLFGFFAESRGKKEKEIKEQIIFEKIDEKEANEFKGDHYGIKCIIVGDAEVGKTQIMNKFLKNEFENLYNATVGFEYLTLYYKLYINSEKMQVINFQIWDTCGQEIYHSIISSFYRNSSLVIIVYSINLRESFENIENWLSDARTNAPEDAKYVLVGNKIDAGKREVTQEEGKNFADDNKMEFIEVSAKTGVNLAYTEEGKGMAANNNGLENILKEFAVEFLKNYKKEPQSQNYNYSQGEQSDDKKNDDIPSGDGNQDSPQNNNCCQKCCPGDCCKCEDE